MRRKRGLDFFKQRGHLEGLDAEQDDIGLAHDVEIVGRNFNAPLRGKRGGAVFMRDGGQKLVGSEHLLLQKTLKENAAHFSRAQHGDAQLVQV